LFRGAAVRIVQEFRRKYAFEYAMPEISSATTRSCGVSETSRIPAAAQKKTFSVKTNYRLQKSGEDVKSPALQGAHFRL